MRFIDLRSDTVTEPTAAMLKSMADAVVGDDVYDDDPTINKLQEIAAKKLGKEASLFVPSGTFGNQVGILTHTSRGDEVMIPENNHIVLYEVGAPAVISGVGLRLISSDNGKINIRIPVIQFQVFRDNRATGQFRRHNKIKVTKEYE